MSTIRKERNKDISIFHNLCKNLLKYLKKNIVKRYVYPQLSFKKTELSLHDKEPKFWKYFKTNEIVTEEDKLFNLFKDNAFLMQVQKFYESLENIINILDKNKKIFEMKKKEIEVGENKIKLLYELNSQLNQYFKSKPDISLNKNNKINGKNNNNNLGHLSLLKSFNILNDSKIKRSIKDLNILEDVTKNNITPSTTFDNNIIRENNYINNGSIIQIKNEKYNKEQTIINNDKEGEIRIENKKLAEDQYNINKFNNNNIKKEPSNIANKEFKLLNRKKKRDKSINIKQEKYIDIYDNNLININKNKINYGRENNDNEQNKNIEYKYIKKEANPNIENIDISKNQTIAKENNENFNFNKTMNPDKKDNNSNNGNSSVSLIKFNNYPDLELEKALKNKFSCIFSNGKNLELNWDIILEIRKILKKIPEIKFTGNKNKLENPSVIGSYKHFDVMFLRDSLPTIDILFKCKDIKTVEEINEISKEILDKNLGLNYIEMSKGHYNENGIVKVINKCKFKIKEKNFSF